MRTVGKLDRTEIELDPLAAWRRGRVLDAMLRTAMPAPPQGVQRGSFDKFDRQDDQRRLEAARRIAKPHR